ncbi:dynein light chain roadblock-type 1 isoform X1 [Ixodes scapularis]|uniref:dynein light chain roadblock-type 1 isoform X1 n=1 Tax=Ixodes scapularis TaxID=6945 RepID=UPI0011617A52|nr:dynein light chain roadblock-type 1 isoform X1 [Ixodes scapularis]
MAASHSEVEEIFKKLQCQKGVLGVVVANNEGVPIKTTLDSATTSQYASLITQLCDQARTTLRDLDPGNDLTFLRMRTKKHEIMISPDKNYILIVLHNPTG